MQNNQPFKDLIVLELATVLAGPSVGMFLAELGATVIKIENPSGGGDVTRKWFLKSEDQSAVSSYFSSVNWGKSYIALDIAHPEGQTLILELVKKSDILLSSYKPGDAEKLGIDYEQLKKLHPQLIYAHISGFGENDSRVGYDAVVQAESGFMYMNGTPQSGPVKMPVAIMDILAAHQAKEGILLALYQKERTGKGSFISVSLINAAVAALANQAANYLQAGHIPQPMGSEHPNIAPYGTVFVTKDEKLIVLAIGTDRQFNKLCEILTIEDQAKEFSSNYKRVRNREALNKLLADAITQYNVNEFLKKLSKDKIPAGEVKTLQEVFSGNAQSDMVLKADDQSAVRTIAFQLNERSPRGLSPPPPFNAHAKKVLQEILGKGNKEIKQLQEKGIIIK